MWNIRRTQVQPIGIDIGRDSIKMLQLEKTQEGWSVVAAARRDLPAETDPARRMFNVVKEIRQTMRQTPFKGTRAVVAIPREVLHVKNLRLPPMPAGDLANAVQFEAQAILPFPVDQAIVHHLAAGEVRQSGELKQEVIMLGALKSEIDVFLESLHEAGIWIDSLDAEPVAMYRSLGAIYRRQADEKRVHVMLDIGASRSQVVIGQGRQVSFMKSIDIGGRHLTEAVARKLGIKQEEAQSLRRRLLSENHLKGGARDAVRQAMFDATRGVVELLGRELSLCLRYYTVTFRGHRPTTAILSGGEAEDPFLIEQLNAVLPVAIETMTPLARVNTERMRATDRRNSMSEWAIALGLGMRMAVSNGEASTVVVDEAADDNAGAPGEAVADVVANGQPASAVDIPEIKISELEGVARA